MSLGGKCFACGGPLPKANGRKYCSEACKPDPGVRRQALEARLVRMEDLVRQREGELHEVRSELDRVLRQRESLVETDRGLRAELSLKDQEIERLRGERGLSA